MEQSIVDSVALAGTAEMGDLTIWGLFLRAHWVVKIVMIMLFFASVWTWAIILDKMWRLRRLESRALKYIEENVLQAPRSVEEGPGYEIPYLYFDYLRTGDARPLKGVFYHNAMDVVAMAALLSHTAKMLADPFHEALSTGWT